MKCAICNGKIEKTFLGKIKGTYIKKKLVCSDCQRKYNKEELLKKCK
jgi:DNA polymerase II large subunit